MMRTAHRLIAAVLLVLSGPAFPNDKLCGLSESVVFSCPVERGKTISVCASSSSQKEWKIAYRFGTSNKIDLALITGTSPEATTVEYNHELLARAYNTFVRFKSGEYAYAVQQQWDGADSFFAGVKVYRVGKLVARLECIGARTSLNFELLQQSRIPVSGYWPE
jgi:hypothetical protein